MSVRVSSEARGNSLGQRPSERLAERRRTRRRNVRIVATVLLFVILGALVYGLRQSSVRISHVVIYGADQSFAELATSAMQGSYLGLVPRDSMFFVPESRIRSVIMSAHPDIAAVSIFHNGLNGLSIKVDYRVPIAEWCPSAYTEQASSTPAADCYVFDANGFVYAGAATDTPLNSFVLYAPLVSDEGQTSLNLVGITLPHASVLPAAFDLARRLATFGSPVVAVSLRGDEVDEYLESGTRITYVLGGEENAYTALVSGRGNVNLADGSVEYVDLRFSGKVYLKRKK